MTDTELRLDQIQQNSQVQTDHSQASQVNLIVKCRDLSSRGNGQKKGGQREQHCAMGRWKNSWDAKSCDGLLAILYSLLKVHSVMLLQPPETPSKIQ